MSQFNGEQLYLIIAFYKIDENDSFDYFIQNRFVLKIYREISIDFVFTQFPMRS